MPKRLFSLLLCLVLLVCLVPSAALAEVDYDAVTVKKGDTILKLLAINSLSYETEKYVVMVLNRMDRESQMEKLSIGDVIKIPRAPKDIVGSAPHLISNKDTIGYYVVPQSIKEGDTIKYYYKLWGLRYNDYVDIIKSLNPGRNLDMIYAGELYYLPTTENNLKTNVYTTVMCHVMLEDETVESVFSRYGIDFEARREELQRYNTVNFDRFRPGSKLYIPLIWD